MYPLSSVSELQTRLGAPELVIVDCRHELANPAAGRAAYLSGHIPGAIFLHLDEDLSGPMNGRNGRHPLPDVRTLVQKLAAAGIGRDSHVVAYDAAGGPFAARLWWLLRWLGLGDVQVLDGGWPAWLAAGAPVSTALPPAQQTDLRAEADWSRVVTADEVEANLAVPQFTLVDARSPERFVGIGETLDPVGGHIPGARNRFFMHNLQADGRFKPGAELLAEWLGVLGECAPETVVHQCGSGVTACHNQLALAVAGLPQGRLYAGSWSEWCSDPLHPVSTEPPPDR
ncbi:sulfurtransferase [Chitinilyticum piscinae]|uniref:Sulfurtransferase n=1 Tax=Chitinilyticum piscinae TaxID=2866724 RepID=A0A8J7FQ39_9NEIS|nr:sulfurtransferase [Chitinilyticum piscinae]MBE9608586.1 sulfurtransferase [Chitinilyticum piscinae]